MFFYITYGLIVSALMQFYLSMVIQPWFCWVTQHANSADAFSRVVFFFVCCLRNRNIVSGCYFIRPDSSGERWNSVLYVCILQRDTGSARKRHPRNVSICLGIWVCVCPISSIFSGFYRLVDKTHPFSFSSLNTKPVC